MLKFEIDQEAFEALEESQQALYDKHGDKYRLQVEGIDPADELKEALRKEREERAEAKRKLQEFEQQQTEAERKRMEEQQQFEELYKTEQTQKSELQKQLEELKRGIADKERNETALTIVGDLTRDTARAKLLQKEAMQYIAHTPEGVKINGPDGSAWDAQKLADHLKESYPFLIDGSGASGGGAAGSNRSGAANKAWSDMTEAEHVDLYKRDPEQYRRLKAADGG